MNLLELPPLLSWVPEVVAVVAGGFYLHYRSVRHRHLKYKYAAILLQEQASILAVTLNPRSMGGFAKYVMPDICYNGLVASTNIIYIPSTLHGNLYTIYRMVGRVNDNTIRSMGSDSYEDFNVQTDDVIATLKSLVEPTIKDLKIFRDKCKPRWYDRLVIRLMDVTD